MWFSIFYNLIIFTQNVYLCWKSFVLAWILYHFFLLKHSWFESIFNITWFFKSLFRKSMMIQIKRIILRFSLVALRKSFTCPFLVILHQAIWILTSFPWSVCTVELISTSILTRWLRHWFSLWGTHMWCVIVWGQLLFAIISISLEQKSFVWFRLD
jgi:hypothetical protein